MLDKRWIFYIYKMDMDFFNRLAKSNASTICRNGIRDFVVGNPVYMDDLISFATDLNNKNQYKGVWIVEMLAETHPEMLLRFIDQVADVASQYKHESAIRGISRTILFLSKSTKITLTESQQEKFIETSLDRLIGDYKVAPKAFAMYALGHFAQKYDWIKEELRNIINKDFPISRPDIKHQLEKF